MYNVDRLNKVKNVMLCMQRLSWEQGIAAQALLELGESDLVVLMAEAALLRQGADGRLALMEPNEAITDPTSNAEPLLYAAEVTGDKRFTQALEKNIDFLLFKAPKNADGIIYHWPGKKIVMVDSYYMAPPALALTGHFDEAVKQIEGFRKLLWNDEEKLFSHMWNDEKMDFESKAFWGVGNGWAITGIARVIKALPESMSETRKRLEGYVREAIDGCLKHMRDDGLFHYVLDDPGTFVDTNPAQEIAYAIFRGVKAGWLDNSYLESAKKMRYAVHKKVDELGIVQDVSGAPTFDFQGIAPEAQAFFLLMEAAVKDLQGLQ